MHLHLVISSLRVMLAYLAGGRLQIEAISEEITFLTQEPAAQLIAPTISQAQYEVGYTVFPLALAAFAAQVLRQQQLSLFLKATAYHMSSCLSMCNT